MIDAQTNIASNGSDKTPTSDEARTLVEDPWMVQEEVQSRRKIIVKNVTLSLLILIRMTKHDLIRWTENHEMNVLNLIKPSLKDINCNIILSNHDLIRLKISRIYSEL